MDIPTIVSHRNLLQTVVSWLNGLPNTECLFNDWLIPVWEKLPSIIIPVIKCLFIHHTCIKQGNNRLSYQRAYTLSHKLIHTYGWKFKFPKSWTFHTKILKVALCPLNIHNLKYKCLIVFSQTVYVYNKETYSNSSNLAFWGWLSRESQPQNPEFRNNPESLHPCMYKSKVKILLLNFNELIRLWKYPDTRKIKLLIGKQN